MPDHRGEKEWRARSQLAALSDHHSFRSWEQRHLDKWQHSKTSRHTIHLRSTGEVGGKFSIISNRIVILTFCHNVPCCSGVGCLLLTIHKRCTWFDNKVREIIAVKVLHTSLLNTTVVTFKVLTLGSYVPMPAPSPSFKTILELGLWKCLQSCPCITPDVINVIKTHSFQYFL